MPVASNFVFRMHPIDTFMHGQAQSGVSQDIYLSKNYTSDRLETNAHQLGTNYITMSSYKTKSVPLK